jgi:hypothetical protein
MPMVLAFLGAFYLLFTVTAFVGDPARVLEVFRAPDLQMVLFFAFFILTDPPTSPTKYPHQIIDGILVAVVSYAIFEGLGAAHYFWLECWPEICGKPGDGAGPSLLGEHRLSFHTEATVVILGVTARQELSQKFSVPPCSSVPPCETTSALFDNTHTHDRHLLLRRISIDRDGRDRLHHVHAAHNLCEHGVPASSDRHSPVQIKEGCRSARRGLRRAPLRQCPARWACLKTRARGCGRARSASG